MPLWLAAQYAADGDTYWVEWLGPVLATFGIDYRTYWWELTVHEHAALVARLPEGADGG